MRKILTFATLAFFSFACGDAPSSQADLDKGKDIYKKFCVACHGENGELALNGAKKFPESTLSLEERVLVITNGRNMMTPFKGMLDEEEIKAVAAYTMELSKKE